MALKMLKAGKRPCAGGTDMRPRFICLGRREVRVDVLNIAQRLCVWAG